MLRYRYFLSLLFVFTLLTGCNPEQNKSSKTFSKATVSSDCKPALMANSLSSRNALAEFFDTTPLDPAILNHGLPDNVDIIVWASHSKKLPEEMLKPDVIKKIKTFIENGGGLFLVSHANRYVADMGIESSYPDFLSMNHLGRDPKQVYTSFGLNCRKQNYFTNGLSPEEPLKYPLVEADTVIFESCQWRKNKLTNGNVLAGEYFHSRDKIKDFINRPTLIEWNLGKGKIIGYTHNLHLEPFNANRSQENLHQFINNCISYLSELKNPRIAVLSETPTRLGIDDISCAPQLVQIQPHTLHNSMPNLPYIAHWGWEAPIIYQRQPREPVDPDYFKKKIIDEAFQWGANLIEFYPYHTSHGWIWPWSENDPIPKPKVKRYPYWRRNSEKTRKEWSYASIRQIIKYCHEKDFLFHSFYGAGIHEFDAVLLFIELQARELMNACEYDSIFLQDGLGMENVFLNRGNSETGQVMDLIWRYNPGAYYHTTAAFPAHNPAVSGSLQCAVGRATGTTSSGFADQFRYIWHPPLYLSSQADCRVKRVEKEIWPRSWVWGGGSYPDWIIRQANDFCRDRMWLDTGLWWLGEPEATLPSEYRDYVYAASADPLKAALTYKLSATGIDGHRHEIFKQSDTVPFEWVHLQKYPSTSSVIHNNYLRVVRFDKDDKGILEYDLSKTALFHDIAENRKPLILSDNFIKTSSVESSVESVTHKHLKIGPVVAKLSESIEYSDSSIQNRIYRIRNDWPGLTVDLTNKSHKKSKIWSVLMSFSDYEKVSRFAKGWKFEDLNYILPEIFLAVEGDDVETKITQDKTVELRFKADNVSRCKIHLFINDGLYDSQQLSCLAEEIYNLDNLREIHVSGQAELENSLSMPMVQAVKISNPGSKPYFVCEKYKDTAAWTVRAAQPGKEYDILKLYMSSGSRTKVQPYGFIDDVVKPGWGCQYSLVIFDDVKERSCNVEVVKTGPFIFAPRIEWKEKFNRVLVNGKKWSYFDGANVFLPNQPGKYEIEVGTQKTDTPTLTRTFLDIKACYWNKTDRTLTIDASMPHWWEKPLEHDRYYYAMIKCHEKPEFVEGNARLMEWDNYRISEERLSSMKASGFYLQIRPGKTIVHFSR